MITLDDFKKLEIKIGKVTTAEAIPDSDKLIKLTIDFGSEVRTILTAVREFFDPEYFVGKQIPVLINLEPKMFRGVESQGMMLAADAEGKPVLLHPEVEVTNGAMII